MNLESHVLIRMRRPCLPLSIFGSKLLEIGLELPEYGSSNTIPPKMAVEISLRNILFGFCKARLYSNKSLIFSFAFLCIGYEVSESVFKNQ